MDWKLIWKKFEDWYDNYPNPPEAPSWNDQKRKIQQLVTKAIKKSSDKAT